MPVTRISESESGWMDGDAARREYAVTPNKYEQSNSYINRLNAGICTAFQFIEMINKAGNLRRRMAGIEPTPSKSNDWTPLSPCQLSQGGGAGIYTNTSSPLFHFEMEQMFLSNKLTNRFSVIPITTEMSQHAHLLLVIQLASVLK